MKKGLKKTTDGSITSRIAKILFVYCNISMQTGNSPAKLLLGRQDLINIAEHVENKKWNKKISHDNSVQSQPFSKGHSLLVQVYGQNHK